MSEIDQEHVWVTPKTTVDYCRYCSLVIIRCVFADTTVIYHIKPENLVRGIPDRTCEPNKAIK